MHTSFVPSAARPQTASSTNAEVALALLGPSTAMSQLWAQIRRLAPHIRTVLLAGAPGAGHEAVARLLLDLSPLPKRSFLILPEAEAEDRLARLSTVNTLPIETFLYLPEVDRLSPAAQHGLLRLLRTRRSHAFSVAAATSEDLRALVSMGRFSAELADALGSVRVAVPSLKDRVEDLPMLLTHTFALRCQKAERPVPQLSEPFLRAAMQHAWSRNLDELGEIVDGLLVTVDSAQALGADDFQRAAQHAHAPQGSTEAVRLIRLDTVVQEHIYAVLHACRGNKLRAADVLGISRSTLYRMLDAAAQNNSMRMAS